MMPLSIKLIMHTCTAYSLINYRLQITSVFTGSPGKILNDMARPLPQNAVTVCVDGVGTDRYMPAHTSGSTLQAAVGSQV